MSRTALEPHSVLHNLEVGVVYRVLPRMLIAVGERMETHTRWLKRRLSRRRSWKLFLVVCCLCFTLVILYWHADYVVSKEVEDSIQKSLDTAWENWKDLLDKLTSFEGASFDPVPNVDCRSEPQSAYAFCNPELSPSARATDLVSRLSVEEVMEQTSFNSPAIPRLGINAYNWKSRCLHGWSRSGRDNWLRHTWTVFPAPIGLGATFNPQLLHKVGQTTADEGRALHNLLLVAYDGDSVEGAGLNCVGSNAHLLMDPRRPGAQETYGEDPLLASKLGVAYTAGLQGALKYLKVAASSMYTPLSSCRGEISLHDLHDSYLSTLKSLVQAGNVSQIFSSGIDVECKSEGPDALGGHEYLMKRIIRQKFRAGNISVCSGAAGKLASPALAAALLINATTDINLGEEKPVYLSQLQNALKEKLVAEQTLRNAVWRSFYLRIRLGDFDPPELVPYQYIDSKHLNTPVHQTLNLQAARESIVLLKNLGNLLPLHVDSLNKLAVIGPNANATSTLLSGHGGNPAFVTSILQGIRDAINHTHVDVEYQPGCASVACSDTSLFEKAVDIVHDANFVIMVMGLDYRLESEDQGRVSTQCESIPVDALGLPGCQERLVEEVIDYSSRVILILINGGPLVIPNLFFHKGVVGIVEAFYPGALGGKAVADVLFGRYNPAGRMPYTTLYSEDMLSGHTYRYLKSEPLIPFGYGLSYSEFEYSSLAVPTKQIQPCDSIKLTVSVQNVGDFEGDEVIQVYVRPPERPFIPSVQLVAFERVSIHSQAVHVSTFELRPYLLSFVDEDGERYIFPGKYTLVVTGGLEEMELSSVFTIEGNSKNIDECPHAQTCLVC